MKKRLEGIAIILFAILLSTAGESLNDTLFSSFSEISFGFFAIIIGIIGLVFVFNEEK